MEATQAAAAVATSASGGQTEESWMWDTKYHRMSCGGISDAVSVAEFRSNCRGHLEMVDGDCITKKVASLPEGPVRDFGLTEMLNVSSGELATVKAECNVEKLVPISEIESVLKLKEPSLPKDSPFKSIQYPKLVKNFLLLGSGQNLKQGNFTATRDGSSRQQRPRDSTQNNGMESEIVLTVLVFHPIMKRPDQQFYVLSSQLLTTLRDKIICPCDYFVAHDFSDNVDSYEKHYETRTDPPNVSPSAFFFVNSTFYSDLRHPQGSDYRAKEIIQWTESQNRIELSPQLDHFSTKTMEETRFEELTIRLGYPYLYSHHGNCEHMLVFTDLRLYNPSADNPNRSDYPILIYKHKVKHRLCSVCNHQVIKWVTEDDDLAPESPCFFCKDCFKKLHYSKDNKKLCNFKAYPYKSV